MNFARRLAFGLALATPVLLLAPPPAAWSGEIETRGEDAHAESARKAAAELWKAVDDARKKEMFGEARRQAARVLALDGDHLGARALLGFVRQQDAWVADANLAAKTPEADFPDGRAGPDVRAALREWRGRTLRLAEKRAVEPFVALATKLAKAGDHDGARKARLGAISILPDLETVRGALGQVRFKDAWLTAEQVRHAETARVTKEIPPPADLEAIVGGKLTAVESSRCVLVAPFPAERLVPIVQGCEDVISLLLADLGRGAAESPAPTKLRFVVCGTREQWDRWVDGTQTPQNREFFRKLFGVWGPPWSYGVRLSDDAERVDENLRDHVVHRAAHWAGTQAFGVPWVSWLDEGLAHHYVLRSEGRAGTWCANPDATAYAKRDPAEGGDGWIQPEEWRDLTWKMVAMHDSIPLRALGLRKIHEHPTVGAIEAWSFVTWWRGSDPDGFRAFIGKVRGAKNVTEAVEAARGTKIEDVEELWKKWVLID